MKIVLVTTTIHVPEVLEEYGRLGPDVPFIVAGDQKSPHEDIWDLSQDVHGLRYLHPEDQQRVYPDLSDSIGWDCVQRRNIAILEAAKLEPDVIVSIDDDNAPTSDFFSEIAAAFATPRRGYLAEGEWFNIGELAKERFTYRGYPYRFLDGQADYSLNGEVPHEIGILNGLIFGDPDINARERIDSDPRVTYYDAVAQRGITVDPSRTWTPINAQNTAYRAELAPLMLQLPRVGRYDDIWGSYIAQRVLADTGLHVHFGRPFVKQDRHPHDLEKDLAAESYGAAWTLHLAGFLRALDVPEGTVLERLRAVLTGLESSGLDLPFDFFDHWVQAWERLA